MLKQFDLLCLLVVAAPWPLRATQDIALQLRAGDAIRLAFMEEPERNGEFPVDAEGLVLLPFLGLTQVADRPFVDVRRDLLAAYNRELVDPVIQVIPIQRVTVLGEVRRPGLFPADPTLGLLDLLASAGGLLPSADRDEIMIVRNGEVIGMVHPDTGNNTVQLRSGDQIVVGRRSWVAENTPFLVTAISSVAAAAIAAIIAR